MMLYLVGPAVAGNANLMQNDFVAGLPSPSAALGFAGALVRRVNDLRGNDAQPIDPWSVRVLPVLHRVSPSAGRLRPEPKKGGRGPDGRAALKAVEIPETLTGEVIFSLVIDIDAAIEPAVLRKALPGMRFAGGILAAPGFDLDGIHVRRLEGTNLSNSTAIDRGFAMVPAVRRDDAAMVSFGEELSLRSVFERLREPRTAGSGYLVPVAAGLRLLEDAALAKPRAGGRDARAPHVFSEPGVGIAELISIRNPDVAQGVFEDLSRLMWSWAVDDSHRHVMFSEFHLSTVH